MAIGDAFAQIIGTAATNRQPASGVEEQLSSIIKTGGTDHPYMYDGTNTHPIVNAANRTDEDMVDSIMVANSPLNMALMMTNTVYFRKNGTTDAMYIGGVQTNA